MDIITLNPITTLNSPSNCSLQTLQSSMLEVGTSFECVSYVHLFVATVESVHLFVLVKRRITYMR